MSPIDYVMQRVLAALQQQIPEVAFQGTCDLTWQNRKFSGNSLRIARGHLLYHGTMLYRVDLDLDRPLSAARTASTRLSRGSRSSRLRHQHADRSAINSPSIWWASSHAESIDDRRCT